MTPYSMPLWTILTKWTAPSRPGRGGAARNSRGKRLEQRIQVCDRGVGPADPQAVAALEPPHATAGATVDVTDPGRLEFLRAADVVAVGGIAAVDHDVAGRQPGDEVVPGCGEGGR